MKGVGSALLEIQDAHGNLCSYLSYTVSYPAVSSTVISHSPTACASGYHHSYRNNISKNDTGLTGTIYYDIFRSITRLQTVLLHSIHCKHQFRILSHLHYTLCLEKRGTSLSRARDEEVACCDLHPRRPLIS